MEVPHRQLPRFSFAACTLFRPAPKLKPGTGTDPRATGLGIFRHTVTEFSRDGRLYEEQRLSGFHRQHIPDAEQIPFDKTFRNGLLHLIGLIPQLPQMHESARGRCH